jgi:PRTRC genetic system protein B
MNTEIESFAVIFNSFVNEKRDQHTTVTSHPISTINSRFVLGAGQVLSMKDQSRMAALLVDNLDTELKIFPDSVIARSFDSIVWYREAKPALMRFIFNDKVIEQTAPCPNLIFKIKNKTLSVVAVGGKRKPTSESKLYHAPFANIYEGTDMCVGSNELPPYPSLTDIDRIERMFFESEFTDTKHNLAIKQVEGWQEHVSFWESIANKKSFPNRKLNYVKDENDKTFTLLDWVES